MKKIRVLIVDDNALIRRILSDIINNEKDMEVAGIAFNGIDAVQKTKTLQPDVVTLDLEMPKMDGITALKEIMAVKPLPVIMVSSHTTAGGKKTLEALSAGAVDFITKPDKRRDEASDELGKVLPDKIRAASMAVVDAILRKREPMVQPPRITTFKSTDMGKAAGMIVAIGSSTGGPRALEEVLRNLPPGLPASFLITQHMPAGFTKSLAERLDGLSGLSIKEAEKGDIIKNGWGYIAPGGYHIKLNGREITLDSGPKVNYVRPAADVMLDSLAGWQQQIMVVILTGMGRDGASGVENLKSHKKDTIVIVQDPDTSVVRGMPDAAIKTGFCDIIVQLQDVAGAIVSKMR